MDEESSVHAHEHHASDCEGDRLLPVVQPFRFLDLPAELRNRIYQACIETANTDKRSHDYRHETRLPSIAPHFFLTQVCHQIRREFRPMFMANMEVRIGSGLFEQYLTAFFPPSAIRTSKSAGNITIELTRREEPHGREVEFDLLPLMTLSLDRPEIRCSFLARDYDPTDVRMLNDFLVMVRSNSELWRTALKNDFDGASVFSVTGYFDDNPSYQLDTDAYIHLAIRPTCQQPWTDPKYHWGPFITREGPLTAYLQKLGWDSKYDSSLRATVDQEKVVLFAVEDF